ncbi:MAG: chorismate synthase [Deltaproteobacteria bacterium]|nr:chorismate synthase [Deltaproteobacteria bacterium]
MLQRLRMLVAGESHGPALVGILEGMPAGVPVSREALARDLRRRRLVAGRSARQRLEHDDVEVLAGLRGGHTLGSPVALLLKNAEAARWAAAMDPFHVEPDAAAAVQVTRPRPGHADLAGAKKLDAADLRDVLERASARETAMRTALGALARALLDAVGVQVTSAVRSLGGVSAPDLELPFTERSARADASPVRCVDEATATRMLAAIDEAAAAGDTLGGELEVVAEGLPQGLGSFAHPDRRLSARLAAALASVPAVRGVGFGVGFEVATRSGRQLHDAILDMDGRRSSNRAGGLEGGMTNGMPLVVRAAVKPLAMVAGGIDSVDLVSGEPSAGHVERSDVTAVPAAAVVAEAMVCLVLADALVEKFGGDTLAQLRAHLAATGHRLP